MKTNLITLVVIASLMAALAACKPKKASTTAGICSHPAVNGGMPFEFEPDMKIVGGSLLKTIPDGKTIELVGVVCILNHS